MTIPKKLKKKIERCKKIARKHAELQREINQEMTDRGYDVDKLRNDDAFGYVDALDYSLGEVDYDKLEEYKKEKG